MREEGSNTFVQSSRIVHSSMSMQGVEEHEATQEKMIKGRVCKGLNTIALTIRCEVITLRIVALS